MANILANSGGRQETSICGHKEPVLRKNVATTRFSGQILGLEKGMQGLVLEVVIFFDFGSIDQARVGKTA